jgi:trimeric autotransporter adhesin
MKNMSIKQLMGLLTCSAALVLTGCGGGSGATVAPPATTPAGTYTIGGTVTGLTGGGMVLQNNGVDDVQVPNDGSGIYTGVFPTPLAAGTTYSVTILTQPSGQGCQLSNASGTVGTSNVTNITAVCSNLQAGSNYTVGFNVLGLTGTGLQLFNNSGDQTAPIIPNGGAPVSGTFSIPLAIGALYSVTIANGVIGQSCSVTNANGSGNGTIASANITGITITCIANIAIGYDLSVNVSGLVGNAGLTLQNTGKNTTAVSANGLATFSNKLLNGDPYIVTVASSPAGQLYRDLLADESGTCSSWDRLGV